MSSMDPSKDPLAGVDLEEVAKKTAEKLSRKEDRLLRIVRGEQAADDFTDYGPIEPKAEPGTQAEREPNDQRSTD